MYMSVHCNNLTVWSQICHAPNLLVAIGYQEILPSLHNLIARNSHSLQHAVIVYHGGKEFAN